LTTFFIDRSLGGQLIPHALRASGWDVVTMAERYGHDVGERLEDPDWIRDASENGEAILCKDKMIARRPIEARTVHMCDARVFAMGSGILTGQSMIERIIAHEKRIMQLCSAKGPFVALIHEDKVVRTKLGYP